MTCMSFFLQIRLMYYLFIDELSFIFRLVLRDQNLYIQSYIKQFIIEIDL